MTLIKERLESISMGGKTEGRPPSGDNNRPPRGGGQKPTDEMITKMLKPKIQENEPCN